VIRGVVREFFKGNSSTPRIVDTENRRLPLALIRGVSEGDFW